MSTPQEDLNRGVGGAYVINPETGQRELMERTAEPARPEAAPETAPQADEPAEE